MSVSFKHPILGQEAVVPTYGLGRVTGYLDNFPHQHITVRTYADDVARDYDPQNVRLVPIGGKAE